jgi:pimeloyl-ACP methyl ester carboxylesterase
MKRILTCLASGVAMAVAGLAIIPDALAQTSGLALRRADGGTTQVKLYGPQTGCVKTMIVSHGLGGSSEGLSRLASAMAAEGWRVIVMNHKESGRGELRDALFSGDLRASLKDKASDPARHQARRLDLDATHEFARRNCRPPQFVLAGHSMGAMTTMIEAGARPRSGQTGANRFDAYIALSPQGIGYMFAEGAWRSISKPVLMITGTRDGGPDGDWRTRLTAFEGLPAGLKRLVVIPGASHADVGANTERHGATIAALTREFLAGAASGRLDPSMVAGVEIRDK